MPRIIFTNKSNSMNEITKIKMKYITPQWESIALKNLQSILTKFSEARTELEGDVMGYEEGDNLY